MLSNLAERVQLPLEKRYTFFGSSGKPFGSNGILTHSL